VKGGIIMTLLKRTEEYRVSTEEEAKAAIESFTQDAKEKGYTVSSASYTYKEKKAKGEVIDYGYLVKVTKVFNDFWA
jgi:hypothetical protein